MLCRDDYIAELKLNSLFKCSVYGITNKGIELVERAQRGLVGDIWETLTTDMYRLLKCSKPSQSVKNKTF